MIRDGARDPRAKEVQQQNAARKFGIVPRLMFNGVVKDEAAALLPSPRIRGDSQPAARRNDKGQVESVDACRPAHMGLDMSSGRDPREPRHRQPRNTLERPGRARTGSAGLRDWLTNRI